jgi:hypothetical protein
MSGYDVIGDVHGAADKLTGLLRALGYRERDGSWRHPDRVAVFIGDLIDRGPQQLETIDLVRSMVESGSALIVLGNHEFNAIGWATPDPQDPAEYLRTRDEHHRHQHAKFLEAVGEDSPRHAELIAWFKTLPMWLELDGLRVAHACWDEGSIEVLRTRLNADGSMSDGLVEESSRTGTAAHDAVEIVLKGPEIDLCDGRGYYDPGGKWRTDARFRWWKPDATTLADAADIPGDASLELPADPIDPPVPPYAGDVPVIIGHYWRTGTPQVLTSKVACVDYSAVKGGPLVAYRWEGETELTSDHFQAFP